MYRYLGVAILFILGCSSDHPEGNLLAEAYGNKLYDTELQKVITADLSAEDSIFITRKYVDVWISKQVLLNKANDLLTDEERDKSEQLEEYRVDLLNYEVLNKLALQEIDTFFSPAELKAYYDENEEEFELSQNILKINFFKIPRDSKEIDLLWSSFKANDGAILGKLKGLSEKGGNYFVENKWVYFDDILKEIPINTYSQEHYLNNNKIIKLNDGKFVYFIKILDFKIRSSTSPFSMEMENIKEILLMKRQQKEVQTIETNLLDEAYSNRNIRTF